MHSCETLDSLQALFVGMSYCDMRYSFIIKLYLRSSLVGIGLFSIITAKPYNYASVIILVP